MGGHERLWGDWGVARGHEGVRRAWRRWFEIFGDVAWELDGDPVDVGDDLVGTYRVHARGRESGAAVDQGITLTWTVRDGRIVRVRAYADRSQALEDVGLPEASDM